LFPVTLLIIGFLIIIILGIVSPLWPYFIGAAWTPSSQRVVGKMLKMAEVTSEDVVYDLGSGDGRILIQASKNYNALAVGIEADPLRVIWSNMMVIRHGLGRKVKIIWGNLFKNNIADATVVTLFLWKSTNHKLKPKLQNELKPGCRVVSYLWPIKGWDPVAFDVDEEIYLYKVESVKDLEQW
jgi:hypothetical protein